MMKGLIAAWVTNPVMYVLFFVVLGLLCRKHRKTRNTLYGMAVVLALLFTNEPLYDYVSGRWIGEYDRPLTQGKRYTYGIVLGGFSNWDWQRNRPEFGDIADRLLDGIMLYKQGRIEKLVMASDGSIILKEDTTQFEGNPAGMMTFLEYLGMSKEDVLMETKANNTHENATLTLKMIGERLRTEPTLLITSAMHMRRSMLAFEQEGLHPDAYVTDTPVEIKGRTVSWWPQVGVLVGWNELLHEVVGYCFYKIQYGK